ncbi:MAG: DUF3025 domain-containing protein [Sulfuricellaceae bacterium]|nr:DUF3025 domain-containing protein [Sulfuricellaceae bacterium]
MANPFPAAETWLPGFATSSPMYEPLANIGWSLEALEHWPDLDAYNALLDPSIRTASGQCLRFVSQLGKPLRMEEKYEARIYLSGEVQTRIENWHDFFNALVWLVFPRAKAVLNACHFEAIARTASGGNRDKSRDALTLFDESGVVILYSDESLADLIRDFRWKELFWARRLEVSSNMRFMVFGHSLYEKALKPYIGLTGKALLIKVGADYFNQPSATQVSKADEMIARAFDKNGPYACLRPLPLLGVPGWWAGNESPDFYENTGYFRPAPVFKSKYF